LVDDELPALRYLQMLCSELPDVEVVKSYNNPIKLLDESSGLDFDVCILDITMPGIDGIQLAGKLQGKAIIFSTAYKGYAAEAFDLDAVDYLRKPYQLDRLEAAFLKAREWLLAKRLSANVYVELNTNKGKARIDCNKVAYITVADNDRRDKVIVYKDGRDFLAKNITFDQLTHLMPDNGFCRINRKTLIALDAVISYTQQWVSCSPFKAGVPTQFPISVPYRETFRAKVSG